MGRNRHANKPANNDVEGEGTIDISAARLARAPSATQPIVTTAARESHRICRLAKFWVKGMSQIPGPGHLLHFERTDLDKRRR